MLSHQRQAPGSPPADTLLRAPGLPFLQFERTLIVCEEGASVSYLEGCTAPAYDRNQLHAAVVELSAAKDAEIKYSTVQNWCAAGRGCFRCMCMCGACVLDGWVVG